MPSKRLRLRGWSVEAGDRQEMMVRHSRLALHPPLLVRAYEPRYACLPCPRPLPARKFPN